MTAILLVSLDGILIFFRLLMYMRVQYSYPNLLIALFVCKAMYNAYTQVVYVCVCTFVGSFLATKVFIGNLTAMGRGWVIIK